MDWKAKRRLIECLTMDMVNITIGLINGVFLMGAEKQLYIHRGNCAIKNGKIIGFDYDSSSFNKVIDLKWGLVTPCLINTHIHLGETLFHGLRGQWDLERYLNLSEGWNVFLGNQKQEAWEFSAKATANAMIKYGTGIFCAARSGEVANNYGLKSFSGYPLMESKKLFEFIVDGYRKYTEFVKVNLEIGIRPGLFFHSLYANGESTLKLAQKCLSYYPGFLTVHVAETIQSVNKTLRKWGLTDIEVLQTYNLLNSNTILVHGGYFTHSDLESVSKFGTKMVLCPVSNKRLKTECLNPRTLEAKGIKWCIATDGLGTGISANLFDHMRFMKWIFPEIEDWELWASVTFWASQVLGIETVNGKLDVGYNADICIFNNDSIPETVDDILKWIIFNRDKSLNLFINGDAVNYSNETIPSYYLPSKPLRYETILDITKRKKM